MYFEYQPSERCRIGEELSQYIGCCFVLLTVSFSLQKLFSFMRSHISIDVLFRKLSPVQRWCVKCYSPLSLLLDLVYLVLCWGFFIYLDLHFVQDDNCKSIWIFLHGDIQLGQHHLLKRLYFFHCMFWLLCQKSSVHRWVVYFWVFYLIPFIDVFISTPISCSF